MTRWSPGRNIDITGISETMNLRNVWAIILAVRLNLLGNFWNLSEKKAR